MFRREAISRRKSLVEIAQFVTALTVGSSLLDACGAVSGPVEGDYLTEGPRLGDPVKRSASVLFEVRKNVKTGFDALGHGGIFDGPNGPRLFTVKHVLDGAKEIRVNFPGLDGETWHTLPNMFDRSLETAVSAEGPDGIVLYDFSFKASLRKSIKKAIKEGKLAALKVKSEISNKNISRAGFPIASDGDIMTLVFDHYEEKRNLMWFNSDDTHEMCLGYSGQPLMILNDKGNLTDEAIGMVVEMFLTVNDPDNQCDIKTQVGIIPFHTSSVRRWFYRTVS